MHAGDDSEHGGRLTQLGSSLPREGSLLNTQLCHLRLRVKTQLQSPPRTEPSLNRRQASAWVGRR